MSWDSVACLPTTIITRNAAGSVTRRLREHYAPVLLTAIQLPEHHH